MAKDKEQDTQSFTVKEGSVFLPSQVPTDGVTVTTGDSASDTQSQLPVVGTPDDLKAATIASFADKLENLMNHAVQQSIPAKGCPATVHQERFAHWANHLGDLLREVKQHAKGG